MTQDTDTTMQETNEARVDFQRTLKALGPTIAERAADHDRSGSFVADNYRDLRDHRLFSAGIPLELGGGGASFEELCDIIRELGRHCGSTALAFAMHTHPLAVNVYKHLRGDGRATATLQRLAGGELVIAGTGANDWLKSSGEAERVEGGFRVQAHKRFVSGSPGADVFVSSVAYDGEGEDEVLHFAIPFTTEGLKFVETWDAMGMRGTGSHDLLLEDVFVPDEAITLRRSAKGWHPMWNVVIPTALPLITAAYVGLVETAVDLAIESARKRGAELAPVVGEMLSAFSVAAMALKDMITLNQNHGFAPTLEMADDILARKAIAAEALKEAVEVAAEVVGGGGFFRGHPVERIVRDVRAMHFHPLPSRRQKEFSGRVALGLDPIE
jgi:alkylation response protein AidB-like acyl-CoA dehydrogenase